MRRLLVVLLLVGTACSGGDDDRDATTSSSSSTTSSTTTTSTSTSAPTTTTTAFEGSTTPTSLAADGIESTAVLTAVRVAADRVVFELSGDIAPGVDVAYVDEVRADGSGDRVDVGGEAHLEVRMAPAAGADLSGGGGESYEGPTRIDGDDPIVEVVRTGDFEGNLTWVVGLTSERPFRALRLDDPARVTVLFG